MYVHVFVDQLFSLIGTGNSANAKNKEMAYHAINHVRKTINHPMRPKNQYVKIRDVFFKTQIRGYKKRDSAFWGSVDGFCVVDKNNIRRWN